VIQDKAVQQLKVRVLRVKTVNEAPIVLATVLLLLLDALKFRRGRVDDGKSHAAYGLVRES
jgi:hypothetical protein